MSPLGRRIDRLEQQGSSSAIELWCCASENDAKALIAKQTAKGAAPAFVFIAGKSNSDGSQVWRVEGTIVADLWRAIDRISPGLPNAGQISSGPVDPRLEQLTDEQLLSIIAENGSTWVLWANGSDACWKTERDCE